MVNLTIGTNAERKNAIVDVNTSIRAIANQNNISLDGANIMINGQTVSAFDVDRTLAQCNVDDNTSAMMSVVVKASAAV